MDAVLILGFVGKAPTPRGGHSERSEESTQKPRGTKRSFTTFRMTMGLSDKAYGAALGYLPAGGFASSFSAAELMQ